MKFTDGFWRTRDGYSVYDANHMRESEIKENTITAYLPHMPINHRGDTLTGPLFTLKLSAASEGVIRVQVWHYKGANQPGPAFVSSKECWARADVKQAKNSVSLRAGELTARIATEGSWSLEFSDSEGVFTQSGMKSLGYVVDEVNKESFFKEQLGLGVGETIYGLGEYFTPLVKNGQVVDIWNADGGTASEMAYKSIPFYLSSRGYGVFINKPGKVSFEVASEKVSRVQFSVPGEYLEYYVISGPSLKQVLSRYTGLTGKPALPPAWSFGLWLTTSFVTDYDEKTVTSFVDGMAERDIPLHVFHFDCFWMKEYRWTNFEWDEKAFPDPAGFIGRLKDRGLNISVWINPYIAQRSALFDEGMEKGYLLRNERGEVYQVDTWQPGMAFVDFTNPEACTWYQSFLEKLMDTGVDCFKTDFGERIPVEGAKWFDGSDPEAMHNYYTFLYNKVVFEVLERRLGKNKAMVFARSATAGGQQFPVHWGGDCSASFESMAESMRGGLSLGLTGFGFWSHDISGFESTASPALYKRWSAFGLLSSHSRLHGNASYRVPWLFDEEAVDVLRYFVKLKCRLMPYLYGEAVKACQGLPMMRAMILDFQQDPAVKYLDRQYMLGDRLLVAPVFSESDPCDFYLPEGHWTSLIDGREHQSAGQWYRETHNFLSLPLYVRENTVLVMGENSQQTDYDYSRDLEIRLYHIGESAETELYSSDGDLLATIRVERNDAGLKVSSSCVLENVRIRFYGDVVDLAGVKKEALLFNDKGYLLLDTLSSPIDIPVKKADE